MESKVYDLYKDMNSRTNGEIYIGVVGPVRTGKSTFIKRFMDLCVLPYMENEYEKQQAQDELPQSGAGRMITTTEPKFIPKEAVNVKLSEDVSVAVRLIDCVGYMVNGALGHMEENVERMVKTPWSQAEIPFTKAAEIGTKKVIHDHATIGIVVTSDGSVTEIERADYQPAEERVISELKALKKPFVVLLNSLRPGSEECISLAKKLSETYDVSVLPVNCAQLKKQDIHRILSAVLEEFPISVMEFYAPKWMELLPGEHPLKADLREKVLKMTEQLLKMRDVMNKEVEIPSDFIKKVKLEECDMATGCVRIRLDLLEDVYYELLSNLTHEEISSEYELMEVLKKIGERKEEYETVATALESVRNSGYGVVTPKRNEISLEKPEVIRHGNKYGVKIRSNSPSVFMIRANIENEIAPIVGSEEQAKDLISYIAVDEQSNESMWDVNIFGKTVEQMVNDGIASKISMIGAESQLKLQDTMQKIVNDSNGGMVCIII